MLAQRTWEPSVSNLFPMGALLFRACRYIPRTPEVLCVEWRNLTSCFAPLLRRGNENTCMCHCATIAPLVIPFLYYNAYF